jgi:GT2 family glycosyltransferase
MIYQRPRTTNPTLLDMLENNVIHGGSLMYRREVFEKIGLFDEALTTGEEYEFNLRAMYNGLKLGYVDSNLYYYRRHKEQKSLGVKANQKERKRIIDGIKLRYNN